MTTQAAYWTGTGAALCAALAAGLADWRRGRRRELDAPGWAPWRGIQVTALFAALAFAILAMHG